MMHAKADKYKCSSTFQCDRDAYIKVDVLTSVLLIVQAKQ